MTDGEPTVRRIETAAEWERALPVVRQLWSEADEAFVRSWFDEPNYRPFGCYAGGELVAVAGVSIQRVLHHARHAWIHDFVVDEAHRSAGYGTSLLDAVQSWAEALDCEYVALALRDGNEAARAFYEAKGMEQWGAIIEREL